MAYDGVLDDIRTCVAGGTPSRLPVFALGLEFDMVWNGLTCEQSRTDIDAVVAATIRSIEHFGYDWAMVFPDDYIEFEPLGLEMLEDPDHPAMVASYLRMTSETLRGFELPDPSSDMRLPVHLETIRRVRSAVGDRACVTGRIAAPFSALGLIYGIEALMIEMLDHPALVRDNLSFFIEHQIAFGRAQIEAGADALWLGDCVASSEFLSPGWFAEFAGEAAAAVSSDLMADGCIMIYHTAETSLPHLKLQTQLPASAVNVGEGVSIAKLREEFGVNRCLMGNFDPLMLRDGTVDEVSEGTRAMIRENSEAGGYMFNTGEGIMANSPAENVAAMMSAARA